jgi:hypothetical protein
MQNHIIKCLDSNQRYTFAAWDNTYVMVRPADLMAHLPIGSVVTSVHDGKGNEVWSTVNGWSEAGYHDAVSSLISFIGSKEIVSAEFTDQALSDGLDVFAAVNSYFADSETAITVNPHLQTLIDIDIEGKGSIHRAKLSRFIKAGETFNVYYGQSGKTGGTWTGDLLSSIDSVSEQEL